MQRKGIGMITPSNPKHVQGVIYPCPLRHQNKATKVCSQIYCTKPRLACVQCFQLADHLNHHEKDLNEYLRQISSTEELDKKFKQKKKILNDKKNENMTRFSDLKNKVLAYIETIQNSYKHTIQNKLKQQDECFVKIINQSKVLDPHNNLQNSLQQIHKSNVKIFELDRVIQQIHTKLEMYFKQSYDDLDEYMKLFQSVFSKIQKPNQIPNQKEKEKTPPTINFVFINNQGSSSILPHRFIPNSKQNQKDDSQTKRRNTSEGKYPNITNIIPSNILNSSTSAYSWSSQLKGQYIQLNGTIATKNSNTGCNKSVVLSNEALDMKQRSFWKIKPKNGYDWIVTGICLKNVVSNNKFSFNPKLVEHGCYGFGTDGRVYIHKNSQQNHKPACDEFKDNDMTISIMFDPAKSILKFRTIINKMSEERCLIQMPKNTQFHIFAFISKQGDAVNLMQNVK